MNRILFSKTGMAKYISHLDLMRTMQRAMLRAGFELKHTQGFNPHPHMVFALPLPVGCESACELMDFELVHEKTDAEITECLNRCLPDGIHVTDAYAPERKFKELAFVGMKIVYKYDAGVNDTVSDALSGLFKRDSLAVTKKTKKGFADVDILPMINDIRVNITDSDSVTVETVIAAQEPSLNPLLITAAIRKYMPDTLSDTVGDALPDAVSYYRKEVYDKQMKIFR